MRPCTSGVYAKSASVGETTSVAAMQATWVCAETTSPYQPYRRAPAKSPLPKSCDTKLWTMKSVPIGRMRSANVLNAPVPVAATAALPRSATSSASEIPITVCVERETMIGHASVKSARSEGIGSYHATHDRARARDPLLLRHAFHSNLRGAAARESDRASRTGVSRGLFALCHRRPRAHRFGLSFRA